MDPSDAVLPEEVELPRDGPWKVIYRNEGWSVAVCTHYGTGEERVGIRWNAYVAGNGPARLPQQPWARLLVRSASASRPSRPRCAAPVGPCPNLTIR